MMQRETCLVPKPAMSRAALAELHSKRSELGYQKAKRRLAAQSPLLERWLAFEGPLADFLDSLELWLAFTFEEVVNFFLCINSGHSDEDVKKYTADMLTKSGFSKTAQTGMWHVDRNSEGSTGRCVLAFGSDVALRVRLGSVEAEITMPPGCALYGTQAFFKLNHAHFGRGRNCTIIIEPKVGPNFVQEMSCTDFEIVQQEDLLFKTTWGNGEWDPLFSTGPIRKWSGEQGGGSVRRTAVAVTAGAKQGGRGTRRPLMTMREARAAVDRMTDAEALAVAQTQYSSMGM